MNIGGIDFSLVWAYQIKCMMANQYDTLVDAIKNKDKNKGKIEIEYYSQDDFERIVDLLKNK